MILPNDLTDTRTSNRTRHIALRERYVSEKAAEGLICILNVSSSNQIADMFTKPLPQKLLLQHCSSLGLTFTAYSPSPVTCLLCSTDFPSKNKLHAHIRSTHM